MFNKSLKYLAALASSALLMAVSAVSGSYGQYIGGDLSLDLDDSGSVRIFGADVDARGRVDGNALVFAADVTYSATTGGSLRIFAADITLSGPVYGDADLYGAAIQVRNDIGEDLEVGGADILIASRVGGEAEIGGALVVIDASAELAGGSEIAAREIYVNGRLAGRSELRAAEVHIRGTVSGPLEIYARDVFIDEQAVLTGPVTVRSPSAPNIPAGAQIGEFTHIETRFDIDDVDFDGANIDFGDVFPGFIAVGTAFASSAFILGFFIALLFPRSLGRMSSQFRRRPFVSTGLGLIVYATFWLIMITLIVLLIATVVGILLAPLVLLAIPIMYFLAFVFGGVVIGDLIFNRSEGRAGLLIRLLSLAAVMVVIAALHVVPPLGVLIGVLVNCIGFGAWTLAIFERSPRDDGPAPAAVSSGAGGAVGDAV